jgi:23S rRNA (adenine2503-C2)-methyltransferase
VPAASSSRTALGGKPFHGRNLFKWVHKHGVDDFDAMTDLPKALREQLEAQAHRSAALGVAAEQPSADGTIKWLLELADGQRVETVFIPEERPQHPVRLLPGGLRAGLRLLRHRAPGLQPQPDQRRDRRPGAPCAVQRWARPPTNVVLMGMGEPLANFDNVVAPPTSCRTTSPTCSRSSA